jgi:hypothetical protein
MFEFVLILGVPIVGTKSELTTISMPEKFPQ